MAHIRQTTTGWVADFTINGKRKQLSAKTKAEAKHRMAQLITEAAECPAVGTFTLRQARQLSLQVRWAGKACEGTAAGYSQDVLDFFGEDTQLITINAQQVERFRSYLKVKGNKASTINWKVSCLQSMLKDAVLYGHLQAMPVLPQRLKCDNRKDRVVSPVEAEMFVQTLQAVGQQEAAAMFAFLLETGCRWGEAGAMRAEHVDLVRGEWVIPKTKNGHPRTVLLTSKAQQALEGRLSGGLVWSLGYKAFGHQFDRVKGLMGMSADLELTIHTLRHTCLSRLAQAGLSLPELQAWGGHRSLASLTRYIHIDTSRLERARAALEAV